MADHHPVPSSRRRSAWHGDGGAATASDAAAVSATGDDRNPVADFGADSGAAQGTLSGSDAAGRLTDPRQVDDRIPLADSVADSVAAWRHRSRPEADDRTTDACRAGDRPRSAGPGPADALRGAARQEAVDAAALALLCSGYDAVAPRPRSGAQPGIRRGDGGPGAAGMMSPIDGGVLLGTVVDGRTLPERVPGLPASGLPIAHLPVPAATGEHVTAAVVTVDAYGRLADRSVLRLLGWRAGHHVAAAVNAAAGVVILRRVGGDGHRIAGQGHVYLSSATRRALRLAAGDQLLAVALIPYDALVLYTMPTVQAMLSAFHSTMNGGDWT